MANSGATYVLDIAEAFATVLEDDRAIWDAFNVGSGRAVTVNEIAQTLARQLHKNIAPRVLGQHRVGDIRHCFADIGKIERVFDFRPRRDFESGMEELIDWVRTASAPPPDRAEQSLGELSRSSLVV